MPRLYINSKGMKTNLLIIAVLVTALLAGCSGEKKTSSKKGNVITFTTGKAVGETITLTINAEVEDQPDVWIDLNNDGKKDEGETVTEFGEEGSVKTKFALGAQTVSIYGKVTQFTNVDNALTALDVTGNPLLVALNCNANELTALDVSKNNALEELACGFNNLTSLDASNKPALYRFMCNDNRLTSLNVTNNPELSDLYCETNLLTSLDVSGCDNLNDIECANNKLDQNALNALFGTLSDRTNLSGGNIDISGNPGAETADTSITKDKKWSVMID